MLSIGFAKPNRHAEILQVPRRLIDPTPILLDRKHFVHLASRPIPVREHSELRRVISANFDEGSVKIPYGRETRRKLVESGPAVQDREDCNAEDAELLL